MLVSTPGPHPLESLAVAIARLTSSDQTPIAKSREFEQQIRNQNADGEFDGLRRIVDLLPEIESSPVCLAIDQFEELFSLCENEEDRRVFIESLFHAATHPSGRLSVVFTLRTDFLGETQFYSELNGLIAKHGNIVPMMNDQELRQAITEPARRSNHEFSPAVVDLLLNQTRGREGALPLLQFALSRIWEGLCKGVEPTDVLSRIGGVGGALAGEAQRIYDGLSETDQVIARRVFLGLVQLGEGTRDTRRRTSLASLTAHDDSMKDVKRVVDFFSQPAARLITLSGNKGDQQTVEITHEALFDHWETLNGWLSGTRDDIRLHRRLEDAAQHWNKEGRSDGLLWRSPDLDLLREFHQHADHDFTELQREFFTASDQREIDEQNLSRRRTRMYKLSAITFATLMLVSAMLGVWAFQLQRLADGERREADQARNDAEALSSQLLVSEGFNRLERGEHIEAMSQFADALHLEKEATDRSVVHDLRLAMARSSAPTLVDLWNVGDRGKLLAVNENANVVAISTLTDEDRNRHKISIRRLSNNEDRCSVIYEGHIRETKFSSDGRLMVIAGAAGARIWDTQSGREVFAHGVSVSNRVEIAKAAISPDNKWVALSTGGSVAYYNIKRNSAIRTINPLGEQGESSFAFSPDSRVLAIVDFSNLRLLDVESAKITSNKSHVVRGSYGKANEVVWSTDGKLVAIISDSGFVELFDSANTTNEVARVDPRDFRENPNLELNLVTSFDLSRSISYSGRENFVEVWNVLAGQPESFRFDHDANAVYATFSSDGYLALTSSVDGSVKIWRADSGELITSIPHGTSVYQAKFLKDGRRLVTYSENGVVRLWDLSSCVADQTEILASVEALANASILPIIRGEILVRLNQEGLVDVLDLTTNEVLCQINHAQIHDATERQQRQELTEVDNSITDAVKFVAIDGVGSRIATIGSDGQAAIWDAETAELIGKVTQESSLTSITFCGGGQFFVSIDAKRHARVWQVDELSQPIYELQDQQVSEICDFAQFDRNGTRLITHQRGGNSVALWSIQDRRLILRRQVDEPIDVAALDSSGRHLAISEGMRTRVWLTEDETSNSTHIRTRSRTRFLRFDPSGSKLVTAGESGTVRIWDVATGRSTTLPLSHKASISRVEFDHTGRFILTSSVDGKVNLWDALGGLPIAKRAHARVAALAFFSGQARLITASEDGQVLSWEFQNPEMVSRQWRDLVALIGATVPTTKGGVELLEPSELTARWTRLTQSLPGIFSTTETQNNAWYRQTLDSLERSENLAGIRQYLSNLIELNPLRFHYLEKRAEAYARSGDFDNFASDYHDAVSTHRNNLAIRFRRAKALGGLFVGGGESLVRSTSMWKWFHPEDGIDPEVAQPGFHKNFSTLDFNDSAWNAGKDSVGKTGGFGYGDPVGILWKRPTDGNRKTAYLRHAFTTNTSYDRLTLKLQRDDGVIVYLDGVEVARNNVSNEKDSYGLMARDTVSAADEAEIVTLPLWIDRLSPGRHILAISLHNRGGNSSDLRIAEISLQGRRAQKDDWKLQDPSALVDRAWGYALLGQYRMAEADMVESSKLFEEHEPNVEDRLISEFVDFIVASANNEGAASDDGRASQVRTLIESHSDRYLASNTDNESIYQHFRNGLDRFYVRDGDMNVSEDAQHVGMGGHTTWSPDGKSLATYSSSGISLVHLDTLKQESILSSGKDPAWCPANKDWIAYADDEQIKVFDLTNNESRTIAEGDYPHWSRSGKRLYFRSKKSNRLRFAEFDSNGNTSIHNLIAMPSHLYATVSPDGTLVAFSQSGDLVIKEIESEREILRTKVDSYGLFPTWSPDGKLLAIGSYGHGDNTGIWIIDPERRMAFRFCRGDFTLATWSPDGDRLAFDQRASFDYSAWVAPFTTANQRWISLDRMTGLLAGTTFDRHDYASDPENTNWHKDAVDRSLKNGDVDAAKKHLSRFIELAGKDGAALADMGSILWGTPLNDEAIDILTLAMTFEPSRSDAYHHRAHAYLVEKSFAKSISDIDRAISYDPKRKHLYEVRARGKLWLNYETTDWRKDIDAGFSGAIVKEMRYILPIHRRLIQGGEFLAGISLLEYVLPRFESTMDPANSDYINYCYYQALSHALLASAKASLGEKEETLAIHRQQGVDWLKKMRDRTNLQSTLAREDFRILRESPEFEGFFEQP